MLSARAARRSRWGSCTPPGQQPAAGPQQGVAFSIRMVDHAEAKGVVQQQVEEWLDLFDDDMNPKPGAVIPPHRLPAGASHQHIIIYRYTGIHVEARSNFAKNLRSRSRCSSGDVASNGTLRIRCEPASPPADGVVGLWLAWPTSRSLRPSSRV